MLKKYIREDGKSPADLTSELFKSQTIEKEANKREASKDSRLAGAGTATTLDDKSDNKLMLN